MLVCVFLVHVCTRDRGCSAHPVFPAPSQASRAKRLANLGRIVPRDREVMQLEHRHCEEHLRRSNPFFLRDPLARNDGLPPRTTPPPSPFSRTSASAPQSRTTCRR